MAREGLFIVSPFCVTLFCFCWHWKKNSAPADDLITFSNWILRADRCLESFFPRISNGDLDSHSHHGLFWSIRSSSRLIYRPVDFQTTWLDRAPARKASHGTDAIKFFGYRRNLEEGLATTLRLLLLESTIFLPNDGWSLFIQIVYDVAQLKVMPWKYSQASKVCFPLSDSFRFTRSGRKDSFLYLSTVQVLEKDSFREILSVGRRSPFFPFSLSFFYFVENIWLDRCTHGSSLGLLAIYHRSRVEKCHRRHGVASSPDAFLLLLLLLFWNQIQPICQ